jgi:hypothetical protein
VIETTLSGSADLSFQYNALDSMKIVYHKSKVAKVEVDELKPTQTIIR